ncbi:hypothetical protein [Chromobacterium violaceum]
MNSYLFFVITAIGSGFSAYLGAYLKKKGEDRASKEQFDIILNQLKKTTEATESIKSTLSSRSWLLQQQWSIREKSYSDLLSELWKFRTALVEQDTFFMHPYNPHDRQFMESVENNDYFRRMGKQAADSSQVLCELIGPAAIFLSEKTIKILRDLEKDHFHIATFDSSHTGEYIKSTLKIVDEAYQAVLAEARSELTLFNDMVS